FDLLDALILAAIALRLIVAEGAGEIGAVENAVHFLFAERFGIALALPRLDLPAVLAVVRVDPDHALNLEFLAHAVGALVFLHDGRLESAAADVLAGPAQRLNRLHAIHAAGRPDVFGDEPVDVLRRQRCQRGWAEQEERETESEALHDCDSTSEGR